SRSHHAAALPLIEEMDNRVELARCHAQLGRVAAGLGDYAAARSHISAGLDLSRRMGQRRGVMRALVALSALARAQDDLEGAVLAGSAATALRESIGQFGTPGRVQELLVLARSKLGAGRVALLWAKGAERPPEEVARWVLEGQAAYILSQPGTPAQESAPYGRLTAREQEVAALLAGGLSNRGIAQELVISPATVARHIANIMEKLDFDSRAQIAVWAAEHGVDAGRT
ncbi:LuxR C-terminal-related transcriptional regulator, partial [Nonomuraea sp. B19D2]|uniref:helix-turn-helix transcriptional regulator n=1 Tax=Nonomuraea sp. B19D2 TaxID=3159561 RepID=UPI0032DB8CA6